MLFSPLNSIEYEVDTALRRILNKRLFSLKRDDLLRLTKLKVWSIRYSVSIAYIIERLVPMYEKIGARHYVRRTSVSKGIGVPLSILTGQAAEDKLKEFIAKDFPDGENLLAAREADKERCMALLEGTEPVGRPRPVLQYNSISEYIDSYSKRIERTMRSTAKLEKKMAKQPWRGNPFV